MIRICAGSLWSFYTPLAATQLWSIARRKDEGSEPLPGENPALLSFSWPDQKAVSVHSSPQRAEQAMRRWNIPSGNWDVIYAPGYQLLNYVSKMDVDVWINLGCEECQKFLEPDMIEILLERGEPKAEPASRSANFTPEGEPGCYLGPLREFLQSQPQVQAAWIVSEKLGPPDASSVYVVSLFMRDPEDETLLEKVTTMAKPLTPVEME